MARGQESAKIVNDFLRELNSSMEFLQRIIPCIIPNDDESATQLKNGLKAINQVDQAVKDCDGDIGMLDELFDIDKLVSEYPKIKSLFAVSGIVTGEKDPISRMMEGDYGGDEDDERDDE